MTWKLISAALPAFAAPAPAQMTDMGPPVAHACPATSAPLPPDLAGWRQATALTAATGTAGLALATLRPGRAADATLVPVEQVTFPVAPEHAPAAGIYGGLLAFTVTQAGTYRISLGAGAWIDLVKDGQVIASAGHGHGPDCSGVRKQVDFALAPGPHLLQVSGAGAPALRVMVAPAAP